MPSYGYPSQPSQLFPFLNLCNALDIYIIGPRTTGKILAGIIHRLGLKNLSTWAHELIHAADDKLGNLTERGQHWRSETAAELGGAFCLKRWDWIPKTG